MANKIVVVTGYMGSGSSAVTGILNEIDGFEAKNGDFEYVFLHCPNGLFDLEDKLLLGNNSLRSDEAIHSFKDEMKLLSNNRHYWVGDYHNVVTPNFFDYCENLLIDIGVMSMNSTYWYYQQKPTSIMIVKDYIRRILAKLSRNKILTKHPLQYETMQVAYPTKEEFYNASKKFLNCIFHDLGIEQKNLVLDQLLLPHNLHRIKNYFDENLRVIVVDRDPRDVFISNKYVWQKNRVAIPYPFDASKFCEMYKKQRDTEKDVNDSRILRIHFEDLIYHYENSLEQLYEFLGITKIKHKDKKKYFNPDVSQNNTRLFMSNQFDFDEIKLIEKRLSPFLYIFNNDNCSMTDLSKIF